MTPKPSLRAASFGGRPRDVPGVPVAVFEHDLLPTTTRALLTGDTITVHVGETDDNIRRYFVGLVGARRDGTIIA